MYVGLLGFLVLLLTGCRSTPVEELPDEQGRKNRSYVKALMFQYVSPNERYEGRMPPPPIGFSYLTIGATYKSDTLRILLHTVRELVDISETAGSQTDSAYIASLIKGEDLLDLNKEAIEESYVIKPLASIDSVKSRGRQYTLDYYFTENGYQKVHLSFREQAYLIDALSDWGLLISFDDVGGIYRVREPSIAY